MLRSDGVVIGFTSAVVIFIVCFIGAFLLVMGVDEVANVYCVYNWTGILLRSIAVGVAIIFIAGSYLILLETITQGSYTLGTPLTPCKVVTEQVVESEVCTCVNCVE